MLNAGDRAPNFALESDLGRPLGPRDYPGKVLVVYFYPKDHTSGCTREAQAFAAASKAIAAEGAQVLGISKDTVKTHCSFRDKFHLTFPLLSDPDLSVHKAFGAYGEKTSYGRLVLGTIRSTFIVDSKGKIVRVFPRVNVEGHADQVLAALRDLGANDKTARPAKAPTRPAKRSARRKTKGT